MTEFSLKECAERLGISDKSDEECAKEVYMNLDKMILHHRKYLNSCLFQSVYEQVSDIDSDVWKGILLIALKMAIESEIGGAVKQEKTDIFDLFGNTVSEEKEGVFNVEWAVGLSIIFNYPVLSKFEKQEEKKKIQSKIESGEKYAHDLRRRFENYCDIENLDSARLSPKTCYLIGAEFCLKTAIEHDEVAEQFVLIFDMYSQMTPAQRLNDFNHLHQKIQEINQSDPFAIMISRWIQNGGDNQGRGRSRG